jgi:hypothetical protein
MIAIIGAAVFVCVKRRTHDIEEASSYANNSRASDRIVESDMSNEANAEPESGQTRSDSGLYPNGTVVADLKNCENLVSYAAITGQPVEPGNAQVVADARKAQINGTWSADVEEAFYKAMRSISEAVRPVSAETLGDEARKGARKAIRNYTSAAVILTITVLVLSGMLFVFNGIATDISKLIDENDKTALTMHSQLEAYRLILRSAGDNWDRVGELGNSQLALELKQELQHFATNDRQLFSDVDRLGRLLFKWNGPSSPYLKSCSGEDTDLTYAYPFFLPGSRLARHPYGLSFVYLRPQTTNWLCSPDTVREALELKLPVLAIKRGDREEQNGVLGRLLTPEDGLEQGFSKIAVYQVIRSMAMHEKDFTISLAGSVTAFILPVFYAMLGACAAILRQLRFDTSKSTFHPEHSKIANRAHMTCAVIVGITIGLFTNLIEGGKDASPLAIAFIAGYASDRFFLFVDRLVETLFPALGREDSTARASQQRPTNPLDSVSHTGQQNPAKAEEAPRGR